MTTLRTVGTVAALTLALGGGLFATTTATAGPSGAPHVIRDDCGCGQGGQCTCPAGECQCPGCGCGGAGKPQPAKP